jgi:pyridinium-3,5-bisthiocarboxylic acid mononucleotide nickel chelatase
VPFFLCIYAGGNLNSPLLFDEFRPLDMLQDPTMSVAYFDCFAGCGGDMIVAALIDAGASLDAIAEHIGRLGIEDLRLAAESVHRKGMRGLHFQVFDHGQAADRHPGDHAEPHQHCHAHRGLSDVLSLIDAAGLPARPAQRATAIFRRLAEAEAKVHGIGVEEVHFHEVGAIDSIVDILAACLAMEQLGIDRVLCSPITLGSGTITCAHGLLPVPAPATAELIAAAKAPAVAGQVDGEATTPTAAAVLTALAESFGPLPPMRITAVGWGAGTRQGQTLPNLLRVFVGEIDPAGTADAAVELSANIDDCSGEIIGATIEKLLLAGCLDAWACPVVMKKSRPAWVLSALCAPADEADAARIILGETTTFGLRRRPCQRMKLDRRFETVETRYGPIRVKVGMLGGREITASPEFEDCRRAAQSNHAAVREVLAEALVQYRLRAGRAGGDM